MWECSTQIAPSFVSQCIASSLLPGSVMQICFFRANLEGTPCTQAVTTSSWWLFQYNSLACVDVSKIQIGIIFILGTALLSVVKKSYLFPLVRYSSFTCSLIPLSVRFLMFCRLFSEISWILLTAWWSVPSMLSLNLMNKSDGIVNPCDKLQTASRISSLNNCVKNRESSFHKIKRNPTDFWHLNNH